MIDTYSVLHAHSHYSLLDGISKPHQMANRCADIGALSCAITDHGTISGCVQFYQAMRAKKIKPILGCEIYVSKQNSGIKTKENASLSHFILLAKNYSGWKTLIKIISESNKESNFYHKPRLSFDILAQLLDGNIIGFCGHLGSYLADMVQEDSEDINSIINYVAHMKEIFGIDNFFLESQLIDSDMNPAQKAMTEYIRNIGHKTNTKII